MVQEIEHKYLANDGYKPFVSRAYQITQGYLSSVPERSVRVRIKADQAFLTVKGIGDESGASRLEWEWPIEISEAEGLLEICEPGVIDKTRHIVKVDGHEYEVDEFHGANEGLVIAEIELASEDEEYTRPSWLGREVTGEARYYNAMLARTPYNQW